MERIYEEIRESIEEYLADTSFKKEYKGHNTYEIDDKVRAEFELADGMDVEVELRVRGTMHHCNGDYYTPPCDELKIEAECLSLVVWNEGEKIIERENVDELACNI